MIEIGAWTIILLLMSVCSIPKPLPTFFASYSMRPKVDLVTHQLSMSTWQWKQDSIVNAYIDTK